jgi:hypothetical protein
MESKDHAGKRGGFSRDRHWKLFAEPNWAVWHYRIEKEEENMAYDPNSNDTRPDLRTTNNITTPERRSSSWMAWVAILAVVIVGAFVWSQMGGSSTDPTTTSSTTPPAADTATPAPATPAAPANNAAPATPAPANGGTSTQP